MLRRTSLTTLAATLVAGTVAFAASHADAPRELKAREGLMYMQSLYLGTIANMVRGNAEYDAEAAQTAADSLVALSEVGWDPLWPEGTSTAELEATRALPAIWEDKEGFDAAWTNFAEAATAMQAVAGNGLEEVQAAMGDLGRSCGGCHDDYREPDD
ncbi:cytochrome c [Jannaschia sp. S6380]|uniref:c-type cytochrome n=1 Tax=Jannaschia sp. S6380 TaxID=2926408 RepID=UPI001FF63DF6|nr:cytochrome c [Jannaschia sp. S6380]MCK0167738.1 cytochrome c [Jannaschia sp. S6380]